MYTQNELTSSFTSWCLKKRRKLIPFSLFQNNLREEILKILELLWLQSELIKPNK